MSKRLSRVFLAVVFWLLAVFLLVRLARADTLQADATPTHWTGWLIALGSLAIIVAVVYAHRRWPSQSAKVDAEAKTALAKAISDLAAKLAPDVPTLTETVPAGKNGVAGVFTLPVAGDPARDLPAINAAYFRLD